MHGSPPSRELIRMLLQGTAAPRPLVLPIVFALGARIENVSLGAYLGNPTKIVNAMRQLRGPLGVDGLTCYCDPFLEVEALGATVHWSDNDTQSRITWPGRPPPGEVAEGLFPPEEAVRRGRIPVAVDVVRRLKTLVRDEVLLTACLSGPFTLAARIGQLDTTNAFGVEQLRGAAMELASEVVTQLSSVLAEAGANVLFLREQMLPNFTPETAEAWSLCLEPAVNIARFYEAVPALVLSTRSPREYARHALRELTNIVTCVEPAVWSSLEPEILSNVDVRSAGVAVPTEMLTESGPSVAGDAASGMWPRKVIATTPDDVPPESDARALADALRRYAVQG